MNSSPPDTQKNGSYEVEQEFVRKEGEIPSRWAGVEKQGLPLRRPQGYEFLSWLGFPQQILKITGVQVLPRSTQETSGGAEKYVPGCEAGRVSGGCAAVDGCSPSRRLSRTHLRIAPPTGKAAGIFTITPGVLIPQHFKHRMPTGPEKTFKYNQVLEAGGHWCDMQSVHSSYRRPPGVTSRVGQGMLQEALRAPALVPRTHTFKPAPLSHVSGVHFNSISPGFNWLPHRCTGPGPSSGLGQDETQHVPGTCDRPGPVQISSPGSTQDCPVMHTIPPPPILPTCT